MSKYVIMIRSQEYLYEFGGMQNTKAYTTKLKDKAVRFLDLISAETTAKRLNGVVVLYE